MNITTQKDGSIVFTGVSNECQYSDIAVTAKQHGCTEKTEKYMTVVTISGTDKQLAAFTKAYNSY